MVAADEAEDQRLRRCETRYEAPDRYGIKKSWRQFVTMTMR